MLQSAEEAFTVRREAFKVWDFLQKLDERWDDFCEAENQYWVQVQYGKSSMLICLLLT